MNLQELWPTALALAIGVLAVTRVVRLIVTDTYPPMADLRDWWIEWSQHKGLGNWTPLIECPWCAAPYVAAPAVLWFASLVAWPGATWNLWLWWIVNGWAALAWIAAWLSVREDPPD
jgi:hypothetical protein